MAQTANTQEPTMEEILASIRRIISEDGDEEKPAAPVQAKGAPRAAAKPASAEEEDDVLELTDVVPDEEPPLRRAAPMRDDDDLVMVERERPSPLPKASVPRQRFLDDTQLISDKVREQAQTSFMQLARNILVTETPNADPRSLEALVQDMLRPILQQWLNDNLPSMVEGLVRQEIEHVTRRGRF